VNVDLSGLVLHEEGGRFKGSALPLSFTLNQNTLDPKDSDKCRGTLSDMAAEKKAGSRNQARSSRR
jgi:hypothetical protein